MKSCPGLASAGRRGPISTGHPSARSAGAAQRRSSRSIESDGWPGGSAEVRRSGRRTVRIQEYGLIFIGVSGAHDLVSRDGLHRLLDVAGDRAPRRGLDAPQSCANGAQVVARIGRGRFRYGGRGARQPPVKEADRQRRWTGRSGSSLASTVAPRQLDPEDRPGRTGPTMGNRVRGHGPGPFARGPPAVRGPPQAAPRDRWRRSGARGEPLVDVEILYNRLRLRMYSRRQDRPPPPAGSRERVEGPPSR